MNKECPHCNKIIEYEKHQQFGAHITNCNLNPKKNNIFEKRKEKLKRKKKYSLECLKCKKEFYLDITENNFNKGKYRKNCSDICSYSKNLTDEDKLKRSISAKKSELVFNANKRRKENIENIEHDEYYKIRNEKIKEIYENGIDYNGILITLKEYKKILGYSFFKDNPDIKKEVIRINKIKRYTEEYRKKISEIKIEYYKNNPEKHPNVRCASLKETYPEKYVREWLENENINFEKQYRIKNYFVDFYIPCLNLGLEIDGERWHVRNSEKEINRENIIKEHIKLIRFWSIPLVKGEHKKYIRRIVKIVKIITNSKN